MRKDMDIMDNDGKVKIEIEVNSEILERTKAVLESWGVDLEYAIEFFMRLIVEKQEYILDEFHTGRPAEDIISEIAEEVCIELRTYSRGNR